MQSAQRNMRQIHVDYKEWRPHHLVPHSRAVTPPHPPQGEKRLKQLVDVVKQVTLRRTKAIIADQLPRKTDNVVFCQLQPLQYR